MENYELTLVLSGKASPAKRKTAKEMVEKLIKTLKGKIVKVDDWGELKLTFKILGNESGSFIHYWLELEKQAVKSVQEKLKLEEGIIRYLLVRKEERPSQKARVK